MGRGPARQPAPHAPPTALSAHPAKNLILFNYLEGQGTYTNLPRSGALVHYQFRVVSSNIPSLIVTSQFCSILPGGTATGSASDSARTRGSPARASHFIWCAPSKPSSGAPKKEAHKATDKGSNRRPSRPEPRFRIHLSPAESQAKSLARQRLRGGDDASRRPDCSSGRSSPSIAARRSGFTNSTEAGGLSRPSRTSLNEEAAFVLRRGRQCRA